MLNLKNNHIIFIINILIISIFTSCSSSKQLQYEKGNSDYTYKRIKKGTYESPVETEYLEMSASTSKKNYPVVKKEKPKVTPTSKFKPSKKMKRTGQESEEDIIREEIYEVASQYLGISYRPGGKAPNTGFDCSGFAIYVFQTLGIPVTGTSVSMSKLGILRKPEELKRGDLVFFGRNGNIHHVGIVSSNEDGEIEMIHSSSSSGITTNIIQRSDYWNKRFMYGRDVVTGYLNQKEKINSN